MSTIDSLLDPIAHAGIEALRTLQTLHGNALEAIEAKKIAEQNSEGDHVAEAIDFIQRNDTESTK